MKKDQLVLMLSIVRVKGIIHKLRATGEREIPSRLVGDWVMDALHKLDEVAYVRFASVYRSFQDVNAFREEIERMEGLSDPLSKE